jgi:hypothetical protein
MPFSRKCQRCDLRGLALQICKGWSTGCTPPKGLAQCPLARLQNSSNAGDTTKRLADESSKQEEDIKKAVEQNKQKVRKTLWQCRTFHVAVKNHQSQHVSGFPAVLPPPAQVLDTILGYVTSVKFQTE